MARELRTAAQQVREGRALALALSDSGAFPDVAIKMVEVGESTGALQEMLNSLADFYDEEIETSLGRFVTLVEPILLIIMGMVIAGLLLALYMPLFNLSNALTLSAIRSEEHHERTAPIADRRRERQSSTRTAARSRRPTGRPRSPPRAAWPSATGSSSWTSTQFSIDHELFRSHPGRPDAALRLRAVPARRAIAGHRRLRSHRPADDRRGRRAARDADPGRGRDALGHRGDAEEERELAARARGSDRELQDPAPPRGRQPATSS